LDAPLSLYAQGEFLMRNSKNAIRQGQNGEREMISFYYLIDFNSGFGGVMSSGDEAGRGFRGHLRLCHCGLVIGGWFVVACDAMRGLCFRRVKGDSETVRVYSGVRGEAELSVGSCLVVFFNG
jgi:hypothetical protein